jgi:hypothetical protein
VAEPGGSPIDWDFFVSYSNVDRGWAEWVAWQLRRDGFKVLLQAWHMVAASNWPERMAAGIAGAERTISLVSPSYLASEYCTAEWQGAWKADPLGRRRTLVVFRIVECRIPAPLNSIVTVDLFRHGESDAREVLRQAISVARLGSLEPDDEPAFPAISTSAHRPRFPGVPPAV